MNIKDILTEYINFIDSTKEPINFDITLKVKRFYIHKDMYIYDYVDVYDGTELGGTYTDEAKIEDVFNFKSKLRLKKLESL